MSRTKVWPNRVYAAILTLAVAALLSHHLSAVALCVGAASPLTC